MKLTSKQRQFLKGRAHPLAPVVRIGKGGYTPAIAAEAKVALRAHELVKVRIDAEDGEDRKAIAERLAAETGAHLVTTVGKVAVLYRRRDEDPAIELPR